MIGKVRRWQKRRARARPNRRQAQRGFALLEIMISVLVIGILSAALGPLMRSIITMNERAYEERHRLNNLRIGAALMSVASSSKLGRLPAPVTSGALTNAIYNPADSTPAGLALSSALVQAGVNMAEVNDDGRTAANVRVYQMVSPPAMQTPLFFQSGPSVFLRYDVGAIYLTACSKGSADCNPGPGGVPGDSAAMTVANHANWATSGTDGSPFLISSLPVQKMMLANTVQRLERLREAMVGYLRVQQLTASASDSTNWYPNQLGNSEPGSLATSNPAGNQDCLDGWYRLDDGNNILPTLGLAGEEFGQTAWGGSIEYCRDYDPTGLQDPDQPPHYAALRILRDISQGLPPDNAVRGNNVFLTF